MNPSGHPPGSSRTPPQSSPLSPLAPPFEPRDPLISSQIQTQIESMQQPVRECLNTDELIQASCYVAYPLELSLVPKVNKTPNHYQTEIQLESPVLNNHFIYPESDQNISQYFDVSEMPLQDPTQGSFPIDLLYPLNQATMYNGPFIPCHPSGMRLVDNQISYSQFNHNTAQNIFLPEGFNPHTGVSGILLRPEDQTSLTNPGNNQNSYHSQSDSRFEYSWDPNTGAYVGIDPRVSTHASDSSALPFGVHMTKSQLTHPLSDQNVVKNQNYFSPEGIHPHGKTQVNQSTSTMTPAEQDCSSNLGPSHQLRNRSDLTKWPMTSHSPHRSSRAAKLNSSNYKSPTSILSSEHQLADVQLDSVQGSLDKEYADESDVPLCDLHFSNIFWRLPRRLFKGRGTPCFLCQINEKFGIVIPGAGKMSGVRDELEEACAFPLMAASAHEYNAQFPSLLPSSKQPHNKTRVKTNERERVDTKIKAGTCSERDGPESQKERNDQERPGTSGGAKCWKPQRKTKQDQKQQQNH